MLNRAKADVKVFNDSLQLAKSLALELKKNIFKASLEGRNFSVALCGGKTPLEFFRQLAKKEIRDTIPWEKVHLFWGDERCVPTNDVDSNFRVVSEILIKFIPIPHQNIHRIRGESEPKLEAERYGKEIFSLLGNGKKDLPCFDWIILGLGIDGHTASIFPGDKHSLKTKNICAVSKNPETGQDRITLTMPVINQAWRVVFIVTGRNKANIVCGIIEKNLLVQKCPAFYVNPKTGFLQWWLDEDAASLLTNKCTP